MDSNYSQAPIMKLPSDVTLRHGAGWLKPSRPFSQLNRSKLCENWEKPQSGRKYNKMPEAFEMCTKTYVKQ